MEDHDFGKGQGPGALLPALASAPSSALVALSGGVDSAVSAGILLEAGWRVEGIFLRLGPGEMTGSALRTARAVARHLAIPLHVLDLEAAFFSEVVQYFTRTYGLGLTPNPCVICNPRIKFRFGLDEADRLGLRYFATGHYARVADAGQGQCPALHRGMDNGKDQSYFLHRLPRGSLSRLLFPLGHTSKTEVRVQAERLGLAGLVQTESQDVCFLRGDYRPFLEGQASHPRSPGEIVTPDGEVIGRHRGLHAFTVGQRRGLGLPDRTPYYVLALDRRTNRLVVGKEEALKKAVCRVDSLNWLVDPYEALASPCTVQIRYRHRGAEARLTAEGRDEVHVRFAVLQRAITPGQFAVFYRGDRVLGGGIICG